MNDYTYTTPNGETFKRVSKRTAAKLYAAGFELELCPCKLNPANPWRPVVRVSREEYGDFTDLLTRFEWANLGGEAGRYTSYYARAARLPRNFLSTSRVSRRDGRAATVYRYDGGAISSEEAEGLKRAGVEVGAWSYSYAPELHGDALLVPDDVPTIWKEAK